MNKDEAERFVKDNFYFDTHGHYAGTIPFLWKLASLFRMPKDRSLAELVARGAGGVVCAIGDVGSFRKRPADLFELTEKQIRRIKRCLPKQGQSMF